MSEEGYKPSASASEMIQARNDNEYYEGIKKGRDESLKKLEELGLSDVTEIINAVGRPAYLVKGHEIECFNTMVSKFDDGKYIAIDMVPVEDPDKRAKIIEVEGIFKMFFVCSHGIKEFEMNNSGKPAEKNNTAFEEIFNK